MQRPARPGPIADELRDTLPFTFFTVGWEPSFTNYLLAPIAKRTGIDFVHGLVGDASRIAHVRERYPGMTFVPLSKARREPLPNPDYALLGKLECVGVPTIRSMVQGDPVLRYRSETESLGYATLLARRVHDHLQESRPDVVLASFDNLHSAISLAVARSIGIPWVALAFPVIPDDLTGFCNGLAPNSLVPISRQVDSQLRDLARTLIWNVRQRNQKVIAFRAPTSMAQWIRQYFLHGRNFLRRKNNASILGIDEFTYPSLTERMRDVARRTSNRVRLPTRNMLTSPPDAPFVYYPFHMAPESMLDTWAPFYQNQLAFVAQLALAVPADTALVVKLHFSDPDNYSRGQLDRLRKLPRLHLVHPNAQGRDFIEKASLVVGIQGTSCLEAALLGKAVLIFGDSPYQHFPRTERARRPDQVYEQIRRLLELPPATDEEIVEAYARYMARYMPGRINDWNRPIEDDEIERLSNCFLALRSYLEVPANRAGWYDQPPFATVRDQRLQ